MNHEEEHIISCPYCGENINVLIDCSSFIQEGVQAGNQENTQEYIEDCQVCCRPITFQVQHDVHSIKVNVKHENE